MENLREIARSIFLHALHAVAPDVLVQNSMKREGKTLHIADQTIDLTTVNRLYVLAIGKAAAPMAQAAETILGKSITGIALTKYGHGLPLQHVQLIEAAHPVPDYNGIEGTRRMLEILSQPRANDLVLVLLSGGGSALLADVPAGCTLADVQQCFDALLGSGATIEEMNTVRKHLSAVKGGQLAQATFPARVVTLILSDVIGDKPEVIASGPTVADPTTFADAWDTILKYNLAEKIPKPIADHLQKGVSGRIPDTPKPSDPIFQRVSNHIIGSNRLALELAKTKAEALGFATEILTDSLQGEAQDAAHWLVEQAKQTARDPQKNKPCCLLAGGETTVTLHGPGKGGRNQELALAAAIALAREPGITLLAAGTDGTDGPTDAAGAIVDVHTLERANQQGIDAAHYLDTNNSYHFFEQAGGHLITGATQTNVMDMVVVLIA